MSEGKKAVRALLGDRDEGLLVSQNKPRINPVGNDQNDQDLKIKFCMEKVKEQRKFSLEMGKISDYQH